MTFPTTQTWNPERIRAMAIYCSDGRWGAAFDEFCQQTLGLPRYDRFAVPGGPAWLTMRHISLLSAHSAARDQIQFLVRIHGLERIVLIAHYGCAFYAEITGKSPEENLALEEEDLRTAAVTLRGWFPALHVEGYLALRQDERLVFAPVAV